MELTSLQQIELLLPIFEMSSGFPYLWFCRTIKSAKKHKPKNKPSAYDEKFDLRHSMVGDTFNIEVMRKGIELFQQYLNEVQPPYISFGVYEGDPLHIKDKRLRLYFRTVEDCGYELDLEYKRAGEYGYGFKRIVP